MSDAPAIYESLAKVMADVQAVAKQDKNTHQGFVFRGIDAVMNAVGPALRTHRVIVTPDIHTVGYEHVQTSTGKPATACRVVVAYTFSAIDGSSITTSVAGEAWDPGDKACPKAMSVAFRTALLQALCLPTDEPDPDTHTYERSTVDLSKLRAAIAASQARDIEGDYDGLTEWAAESQQNADAAVRKLRKAIDAYDTDAEDAATQTGSRYVPPEDETAASEADRSGGDDGSEQPSTSSPPDPAWKRQCEVEGVDEVDVLMAVQADWPKNDQARYPGNRKALARRIEESDDLAAQVTRIIDRLAEDKRKGAA